MWVSNFCEEGKFEMIHESPELVSNEGRTGMIGVGVALSVALQAQVPRVFLATSGAVGFFSAVVVCCVWRTNTPRHSRPQLLSIWQMAEVTKVWQMAGNVERVLGLRTSDLSEQVGTSRSVASLTSSVPSLNISARRRP